MRAVTAHVGPSTTSKNRRLATATRIGRTATPASNDTAKDSHLVPSSACELVIPGPLNVIDDEECARSLRRLEFQPELLHGGGDRAERVSRNRRRIGWCIVVSTKQLVEGDV